VEELIFLAATIADGIVALDMLAHAPITVSKG
jgi:hypothetical protein